MGARPIRISSSQFCMDFFHGSKREAAGAIKVPGLQGHKGDVDGLRRLRRYREVECGKRRSLDEMPGLPGEQEMEIKMHPLRW